MKKRIYVVFALITALVLCFTLVACKETESEPKEYTVRIGTAEDLKNVALGYEATNAVYELEADLDLGEWTPLGSSVTDSFRGEFRGNGHTITYTVNVPEPEERDLDNIADETTYGLFGVTYGATIKDLTVDATVTVPVMSEYAFVGGLIGYAYSDTVLENVTVNGDVTTTLGDIRLSIVQADGTVDIDPFGEDMNAYVGGVVGCATGKLTAKNVRSSVDVTVENYSRCLVEYVFVGGVFGAVRSEDISVTSVVTHTVENIAYSGKLTAYGAKVNAGGVFGAVYRASVTEVSVVSNKIETNAYQRVNIGGIAGFTDKTEISKSRTDIEALTAGSNDVRTNEFRSYNVGGAIGYASNDSSIKNVYADTSKITVSEFVDNYVGGVVGMAHFTAIESVYACGELYYGRTPISEKDIKYTQTDKERSYYIYSGGIAGKLYGNSSLKKSASEFKAYQGLVGNAYNAIEIIVVNVTDGETINDKLTDRGYDPASMDIPAPEVKEEDGKTKWEYRLTHKYDATSTELYYVSEYSKCVVDGAEDATARDDYFVDIGTGCAEGAEQISAIKNAILEVID